MWCLNVRKNVRCITPLSTHANTQIHSSKNLNKDPQCALSIVFSLQTSVWDIWHKCWILQKVHIHSQFLAAFAIFHCSIKTKNRRINHKLIPSLPCRPTISLCIGILGSSSRKLFAWTLTKWQSWRNIIKICIHILIIIDYSI